MRRIVLFAAIGIVTYLLALAITIPARVMLPPALALQGVTGTIWRGHALLIGGDRLEWRWAPLRSLANFAMGLDFAISGARSDLGGGALLRPGGVVLDAVAGRADGSLLRAINPASGFTCDIVMQVDLARLAFGGEDQGALGEIRSEPGVCAAAGLPPLPVPALIAVGRRDGRQATAFSIAPFAQRRQALVEGTWSRTGAMQATITPAGAQLFPFLGGGGTRVLDTNL